MKITVEIQSDTSGGCKCVCRDVRVAPYYTLRYASPEGAMSAMEIFLADNYGITRDQIEWKAVP